MSAVPSKSMRAVIIAEPGGPEVLRIDDFPIPEPFADQVRVRVHATSLNRADVLQRMGGYPAPAPWPASIPGLEIAGAIDAIGPDVSSHAVGDRVFGLVGGGGYAEYALTTPDQLARIPAHLSYTDAAAIPEVFMTAYDALAQARLALGERVLIHAIGSGVGTAALQLAKTSGATVYGTARSPHKLEHAQALGLDGAFGPDDFAQRIRDVTDGKGVEVVIDFVGSPYLEANLQSLAPHGRMIVVGLLGGSQASIDLGMVLSKRLQITGTTLRNRSRAEKATLTARFAAHVVPLFASGTIRPIVDRVFALDDVVEAHRSMESNANFGKIVLRVA